MVVTFPSGSVHLADAQNAVVWLQMPVRVLSGSDVKLYVYEGKNWAREDAVAVENAATDWVCDGTGKMLVSDKTPPATGVVNDATPEEAADEAGADAALVVAVDEFWAERPETDPFESDKKKVRMRG